MKLRTFIKSNKGRWKAFEESVNKAKPNLSPDELSKLYIQITNDLAFARTQYPDADVTKYLNSLAAKVHLEIYRNKREGISRLWSFWKLELPEVIYRHRLKLLYSFLIFSVAVIIGALSAANDEMFVRLILSDQYVDMTIENIEKGNPMGVYGMMDESTMFFVITFNNIKVALRTFIWGGSLNDIPLFLLLSFGTGYLLLSNGIMLGSFQYFFYEYGLFSESALTIWLHGTIEIASIIVAGAAGIIAGNSLMFPGTYRRIDSFKRGVKDGLKIIIGLIPLFVIAGFIESYVTRLEMPVYLKLSIILGSAIFIIFYFVYYPIKKFGNGTRLHRI